MAIKQNQRGGKILVIAGIWSVMIGIILGIGTWYSLFSRYMYVEDLNQENSWGFDDYVISAVSGETPFDLFSYSVALVCLIVGFLMLVMGLLLRVKIRRSS